MAFKSITISTLALENPEALFRDIRTKKIPGLLSQQADLLREYTSKAVNAPDVALQLATGSGKTLVGLLIAEWRRRKFGERVIYLCPTNQLVHQVGWQAANRYGIKLNTFVGKKADYDPSAKSEYNSGEAIAVTSYSSLFNSAPFFKDPSVVILDDAHSAENYIPKQWTVRVLRSENSAIYEAIVGVFMDSLSCADQERVVNNSKTAWDQNWVEKIPTPKFFERIPELIKVLDTRLDDDVADLMFSWRAIRDHLSACHIFISSREILLRPLIPPTFSHAPFANAKQRVYMSATLGEGGDLERITGRSEIVRLQVKGWEKQGIGRRFFLFPERSLSLTESESVVAMVMRKAGRSLVIVPDDESANSYRDWVKETLGFKTFSAKDIEVSKSPFVSEANAVAVIANRYDGIDFPADECRLLIVAGLPRATNLQEKFFIARLGAVAMLNDRILTRMVQAFGRCTRSPTDYAAVIVEGEELNAYLLGNDRRSFLHPELQGELQFGIEQSKDQKASDFLDNVSAFFEQSEEWQKADGSIVELRDAVLRTALPGTADLQRAASAEVDYEKSIWQGDYANAFDAARSVLGNLNDTALRGYRALWCYLAGSAAWLAYKDGIAGFDQQARTQFSSAQKAAPSVSWLVGMARVQEAPSASATRDESLASQIENFEVMLENLGTAHDRKFEKEERLILDKIMQNESSGFELAHKHLGELLGFKAGKVESTGSPDPWWMLNANTCLVFEDHSDGDAKGKLNVNKARQVASHPNWIRENVSEAKPANIFPVLISPVKLADADAMPHLKDVAVWNLEDFREWAKRALQVVRELRRVFPGSGDLAWRATAAEKFASTQLDGMSILGMLVTTRTAERVLKT